MSLRLMCLLGLAAGVVGPAHAIPCYEIVDSGDTTLYRATVPPFALSGSEWSSGQEKLRKEGRHLLWFDSNSCPESYSGPAYASAKAGESASDLLTARSSRNTGGIYTRESTTPPTAVGAGGRPVVVAPAAGAAGAGYSR